MKIKFILFFLSIAFLQFCNSSESGNKTVNPEQPKVHSEKKQTTFDYNTDVEFIKTNGDKVSIKAALAIKPEERNAGLMGIEKLDTNKGMLFVFEAEQNLSFWMANTPLSLDIIFVNADYKIVRIHSGTEPFTTKPYESGKNAKYVIEVNGGFCVENDILEGNEVGFEL
ncbi:DUF192 domain-containing protein [bacterium]|nr:MAG: DUF192 domain-containing protein [bacterium]